MPITKQYFINKKIHSFATMAPIFYLTNFSGVVLQLWLAKEKKLSSKVQRVPFITIQQKTKSITQSVSRYVNLTLL